jgi:hypothetical protein
MYLNNSFKKITGYCHPTHMHNANQHRRVRILGNDIQIYGK